jgi:hypothetical protein
MGTTCFNTLYPTVLGGLYGNTYFYALDIDSSSNFVIGGSSSSEMIYGGGSAPIVALLEPSGSYLWAISISTTAYNYVADVTFNSGASAVAAALNLTPLLVLVLDAGSGSTINSYVDSSTTSTSGLVNSGSLLLDTATIYVALTSAT